MSQAFPAVLSVVTILSIIIAGFALLVLDYLRLVLHRLAELQEQLDRLQTR